MLPSLELKAAYLEVLERSQAIQICGAKDPSCNVKGIQSKVIEMYAAKMMYDTLKVEKLIADLNKDIDKILEGANPVTRTEVHKFLLELKNDTWVYEKMEEMNRKLTRIIQGQELLYDQIATDLPVKPSIATPKTKVLPVQKKIVEVKKVNEGERICSCCRKILPKSDFYSRKGACKACVNEKEMKRKHPEFADNLKIVTNYINTLPIGETFIGKDAAIATGIGDTGSALIGILNRIVQSGKISKKPRSLGKEHVFTRVE